MPSDAVKGLTSGAEHGDVAPEAEAGGEEQAEENRRPRVRRLLRSRLREKTADVYGANPSNSRPLDRIQYWVQDNDGAEEK